MLHMLNLMNQLFTDPYYSSIVISGGVILLTGLTLLFLFYRLFSNRTLKTEIAEQRTAHRFEVQSLTQQLEKKEAELRDKNTLLDQLYRNLAQEKQQIGQLATLLQQERKHSAEKLDILEYAKKELGLQFQSLAHQIFDEKNITFSAQSKERLQSILTPLQEQLNAFKKRMNDIYHQETQERVSLKQEITHLRDLNLQINREAVNLTKALKGDNKIQGNWGEMILEKVLEQSGLRKGFEYETQGGFRSHDNKLLKPDVIIRLPDNKDIIIDSKVSLIAWEKYVNCEEKEEKQQHFRDHLDAIRNHLISLGKKDYTNLKGIRTLDFILMFMPIEAAFAKAFQKKEQLFSTAFASKIIIVSPTTLLATLRSIENIWRFEHQHQNSQEMARRAGAMHDKFCGFVEDMEKLGNQLETVHSTYEAAMNKLTIGRGNLIAQASRFNELGIKAKKKLPKTIRERAELELEH